MGFFSNSRQQDNIPKCKLCDKPLNTDAEQTLGLCTAHALILDSDVKEATATIDKCQPLANAATDPTKKIMYLKLILDSLYTLKVKYYENGVEPLQQDIDTLIDSILDCISTARL